MTVATQSASARQKAEAESFLRRVQVEYPHLLVLGYQAILNATVEGMKALEIYNDNLTESKFMAGLQHAMNTGIVPKPPAPAPPQPTAEELAAQAEQERLVAKAKRDEEDQRRFSAQNRIQSPHTAKADDGPTALARAQNVIRDANQQRAKKECETLQVFYATGRGVGRVDPNTTEELKKVLVYQDGAVDWIRTLNARQTIIEGYRKVKTQGGMK